MVAKNVKVGLSVDLTPSNTERKVKVVQKLWDDVLKVVPILANALQPVLMASLSL